MSRCGESHYKTQPYQRDNPDEQMRGVGGAMERLRRSSRKRPTSRIHGVSCLPDRYPGVTTMVPGVPWPPPPNADVSSETEQGKILMRRSGDYDGC